MKIAITVAPMHLVRLGLSAPALQNKFVRDLKMGTKFQLEVGGVSYTRCRGGFTQDGDIVTKAQSCVAYIPYALVAA